MGLTLAFASSILVPYAKGDDYLFSLHATSSPIGLYYGQALNGRVINGLLLYATLPLTTIEHYNTIRLIGLAGAIWLAIRLYLIFLEVRALRSMAGFMAFSVCVMPGFTFFVASTNSIWYPMAAILAVEAAVIARKVFDNGDHRIRNSLLSIVLLTLGGLIFEPSAMMYWIPVTVYLIAVRGAAVRETALRFCQYLILMAIACIGIYLVHAWSGGNDNSHSAVRFDFINKAVWFYTRPLPDALSFFRMPMLDLWAAYLVGVLIFVGVYLYMAGGVWQKLVNLTIVFAMLPLSFLPHLLADHRWALYRTQVSLTALLILLGGIAIRGWVGVLSKSARNMRKFAPLVVAGIFAATSGFVAARNMLVNVAIPDYLEFHYLKSELEKENYDGVTTINVIRSDWNYGVAPEKWEEFGIPTSTWDWGTLPMVRVGLRAIGQDDSRFTIKIFPPGEKLKAVDGAIIIDMVGLNDLR